MSASSNFFGNRNAQAVLKHGLLTRYAHYFAGRAGSGTGGRVAFIDGYAGSGRYDDGSPGSPLLLASQATRASIMGRDIKLAFVEHDSGRRAALKASLLEAAVEPDQLLGEPFEDVADRLLERYKDRAVLLFVDPFGLAINRSLLVSVLKRRSGTQPIDVLYHLSLSSVARMGSLGVTDQYGWQHSAQQLDDALGPGVWRDLFAGSAKGKGAPTATATKVARKFVEEVRTETGVRGTLIPVRQRPNQLPKYLLILFSADPSGRTHWDFADLASTAHADWLHYCDTDDFEANLQRDEDEGMLRLFEPAAPDRDDIDELLAREASSYLGEHLPPLFEGGRAIRPIDNIETIYGDLLGQARTTHLRTALKQLHDGGVIADDCKGNFWLREIR